MVNYISTEAPSIPILETVVPLQEICDKSCCGDTCAINNVIRVAIIFSTCLIFFCTACLMAICLSEANFRKRRSQTLLQEITELSLQPQEPDIENALTIITEDDFNSLPQVLYQTTISDGSRMSPKKQNLVESGSSDFITLQKDKISCAQEIIHVTNNDVENVCTICLEVLQRNEVVIVLPRCEHNFHSHCIRQWLFERQSPFCPICKMNIKGSEV